MVKYGSSDRLRDAAPHEKLPRVDQSCRLAIGRFPDDVGDRWHVPVLI